MAADDEEAGAEAEGEVAAGTAILQLPLASGLAVHLLQVCVLDRFAIRCWYVDALAASPCICIVTSCLSPCDWC